MFSFSPEDVREQFVSAEQLMRACDQVWSADSRADISLERGHPLAGSCVYCKVDHLIGLFDQVRQVRNRVVLVSSESDRPITEEFLSTMPAADCSLVQHKHSNEGREIERLAARSGEFVLWASPSRRRSSPRAPVRSTNVRAGFM